MDVKIDVVESRAVVDCLDVAEKNHFPALSRPHSRRRFMLERQRLGKGGLGKGVKHRVPNHKSESISTHHAK